jgi:hypothetical protein
MQKTNSFAPSQPLVSAAFTILPGATISEIQKALAFWKNFIKDLETVSQYTCDADVHNSSVLLSQQGLRQVELLSSALEDRNSDLNLRQTAYRILDNTLVPKTAFFSACDQLKIVKPVPSYSQKGGSWIVVIKYQGRHNYEVTSSGPTKTAAEYQCYMSLLQDLH